MYKHCNRQFSMGQILTDSKGKLQSGWRPTVRFTAVLLNVLLNFMRFILSSGKIIIQLSQYLLQHLLCTSRNAFVNSANCRKIRKQKRYFLYFKASKCGFIFLKDFFQGSVCVRDVPLYLDEYKQGLCKASYCRRIQAGVGPSNQPQESIFLVTFPLL